MTRAEPTITVSFDARLLDDGGRFPAELGYRPVDPFAVVIRFDVGSGPRVEWVFARELLEDGLRRPAGIADVRIAPITHAGEPVVELWLTSPGGHARIGLPRWAVRTFLRRVATSVPSGTESGHIDWDLELSLLSEGGLTGDGPSMTS
ncbi:MULTISPECIES: SsgA family sporulation/cell division regulator [Pseudofrankia]|uniref:SsgA family sporulation/cell division regulator n=1 Tax=Pseudofrankia TaxID=2994363 RepID=UPI000234C189|nr:MULTISPECIES: SsgA family sporulation/cell division regulator [Pseudofrankia]OHV41350.1 sporulation protein SsgA [Pseudofrankia sp. EUN1h]